MATGQDYIDKYLRQKGTTNNEGNKDNGTEYRSPDEAEPLADIANLKDKVDADAEAYKTATDTIEKDEPTDDATPTVEQSPVATPDAPKVAPSINVDKPQVVKVDVTNYSRRPEYKIANGKIVGINRYVYTNDNKNYYTENGEKIEAYKSGDKTDMPTLSPEEEVTARVKTVYNQFKDRIANAKPTDFGNIRNDLWKALNWNIDFSNYEDKDAEDKLKDVALGELGRQYQEQNPKMRIKAEAFSPKYYRENLAKESEKENAEAGRLYVKDGASLYDLASGQNMLTNVNQRAIEATKWLNTETQWRIKAAEGEAKRDRGFWSGLKGLGLGLVHGTRGVIHGGVNGGIEASVMAQVASASKSFGEGKELTGDQSRLIDAYLNYCESEKAYQDDFGYCYKLGQNTAISAPFMLEFILNPLSGAGEAAIRGISKKLIQRYGVDWVKQGVARLSNREVKAVMERSIRNYIGKQAGKILTEKTAKVVGKYGAKAVGLATYGVSSTISSALMTATTGLPGVYADKVNRQLNDGESEGEAWRKAGLSAMNERGSEYAGPLVSPFFKMVGKAIGKVGTSVVGKERLSAFASALNKTWPVGATRELIHDIAQLDSYKIMKDITKRAHWDGFFEEDFEEKFGSFMDAAFIGDQHFLDKNGNIDWKGENSFFNIKERFDESVNVGFTTLLLGVGGASGYRTPKYRLANALKTYDALGAQLYGDNWASFKATIESAKPEQLSSVLVGCMQAGASRQQLETLANYAYTYSMLDASVELERGMRESNDADNEQVDAEQSYDDGYTLEKQQRNDAKNRLDDTQKTATSLLHLENTDELDNVIGLNEDNSNAVEVMKGINARTDINDYAKQKLNEYVNARLRYQGTIDAAKDDIDSKIAISDKTIDNQANEEGMVQTATLKNGTAVYIRSGNVSIDTKSGEVISSESDGTLVVQDQVSGEMQMIPSSDVLYLTSNVSADELKTEAANKIRMESAQQHAQEIDGVLPFNQGDVYDMEDKDGNPLQVQVINDLGDGNVNVLLNGQTATIAKEQLQTLNDNYNQRRLQVWKASQEQDTNNGTGQEQGNNENAPTEGAEEKKSALAQIPVDKNGVRQYTQAMPTTAYDALVEATGSREGADQVVEAEKAKAKKALEEALNRKPEGNTTDEIVASAREIFDAKQQAQEAHRYWDAVGRTMQVRSEMRKKGISNAVDMALAAHAALDETEDTKRFNNLAENLRSLKGEEREKVLAELASMAEAYARANGYNATICKTTEEYLQSPGITDDVRRNVDKLGLLVPGHYFQGHVYINIEDMTKVTGISASDMLSSTLLHESTHMDNATDEGGVMAHLRESLDNGEVDMDEALDIIGAVSGTDDYRRQAKELQEQGKSPSELVADELMAHMLQAMSWGVSVESMTKNETITNIINEANERREKVRTSGEEVSQRSESADDVSPGQVQPSGATARDNETEQSGRGVRADGESGVRNSIRNDNQRKATEIETPKKIAGYGTLSGEVTDVADLPKDMAYRETDINELEDLLKTGYMRSLPEGKVVEGAEHKVNTRRGRSFQIGKVYGQSHGGKGFAKGAPWSIIGGTLSTGTATKVIIGVPGNIIDWQVGHHNNYSEPQSFDEIKHGRPLWVPFDEDGDITDIGAEDIRAWVADAEGNYHEFIPSENSARYSVRKRRALETVSVTRNEKHQQTVISSADGAKVLNNLDTLAENYENSGHTKEKTFIGEVAKSLGATRHGSNSEYATFETKNGKVVTVRLANHNAKVSNFDNKEETEGISIVVSPKENTGVVNDGNAHIVEFFYDAIKLRRAEGKPLADIVRSIKQALYSGEFKDTTGLAERQEVNNPLQDEARFSMRDNEAEEIVTKAKADGTYMKAPNGKDTNLTERQWAQVRTKSFKEWFGDWENDPENASKVVDENGEPRVMYHQTNSTIWINRETGENYEDLNWHDKDYWQNEASDEEWENTWEEHDFYEFDNKMHGRRSIEMPAFFFSPTYDKYHEYGDRTIEAFLNIKNPAINPEIENAGVYNDAGEKAMQKLIEQGHDGFIREYDGEIDEINAFYPHQIKSATDNIGTFDANNDDIRFSLRDNESADKVYADEASVPTQEELGEGLAEEVKDYVPQAVPWDGGALYDGQNAPVKYSVRGAALGIGLKPLVGEDGKLTLLDSRGRKFDKNHPVSVDDIKRTDSVLNAMVDICTKNGTLKNPEVIYQKYADFVNRVLEKGDKGFSYLTDQWQWQGEALYRSVHNNSDSQYAKSIDITRICKKNEAVIHTISELQKRQGYGVTVGQILDIYNQTVEDGYQAPCPVCYVFSRYLRNGVYASTLVAGQRRYGNMLVDPKTLSEQEKKKRVDYWVKELDSLEKFYAENKKAISQAKDDIRDIFNEVDGIAMDIAKGKLKGKELADAKKRIAELDKRYRAAVDLVSVSDLTGYIKQIAIEKKDGNWTLRTDSWKQYPEDVALDITRAQEAIVEYPGVQRYRNSHGSAAGKAIQTASNNDLGDTMVALGLGNPEARDKRTRKLSRHNTLLKAFADGISEKEQTKLLNQAKGDIKKATVYAAQQMLRGGIRQWSWSDNVERLSPDVFLNLMQVNMLGGALQAYSKQLEGVELVASMNGYVNGSLMGKGKGYKEVNKDYKDAPVYYNPLDGKYYTLEFDDVVGIQPFSKDGKMGLFDLNKMYDRAGNILVGMDDLHIRAAMADPRVFYIIPWHSSGMTNHILMQFYNYLGVDTNGLNAQDYTKIQEEKTYGADDAVPQEMTDFWESHNFGDKYKSGIGEIPSGNGKLSEEQLHYRELKNAILTHNSLLLDKPKREIRSKSDVADYEFWNEHRDWLEEIKNDEFLSLVLDKVQKTVNALGANMTKGDTEYVYPYEYWDANSTESNADVNGERYLEYCRRLGIRPKFSGITNDGIVDFGNFCEDPGYWKLLIDRRMYDRKGNFQDLTPVTVEGFDVDMVDPEKTKERFEVTRVAELDKISDVVDHVQAREQERGIVPEVDYTQKLSKAVEKYNKATARFSTSGRLNERFGTRWIDEQTNEDGRHTTQVKNTINSYKKFGDWVKRDSEGRDVDVLDASSGLGLGTEWMRDNGINAEDVEPYPSENRIAPTYKSYNDIKKKYDYIISNAVLNVIPDDWRANVLHDMASKLKEGGKMVINVRSAESIRNQGKEGETRITLDDPSEILVLRPNGSIKAYQKGFTKAELKEWCESELGDGYSVEIANNKNAGGTYDTAVVVSKNNISNTIGVAYGDSHPDWNAQALPNSDANVRNNNDINNNLAKLSNDLDEKDMGSHEFLFNIAKSFGFKGNSLSKSFYQNLNNNVGIRVSDHSASTSNIAEKNRNDEVYGLVVKLSPHRFKSREDANYLEYVYYPDKLDGERQKEIVDGLKDFLQTGDFSALPSPDKVNASGKFKTTKEEDEAKFSIRNSSDLVSDISEKGLGGAVGKEAVSKFMDGLYMNDADIRKEINKGIGKAGFNYATATRDFLGDIANGEVSAETWHKVRTAFQGMLREKGINANLTDADIAYALWKEANPGNDVISKAKDIAMQMDMGAGRFSLVGGPRAGMALDEYNRKALSSRLDWQEAWQDAMVSAKALQDAIAEETQSPITDSEDVYHAENRMYGASKNEVEHYEDNYLNPLLKAVSDVLEQSKKNTLGMDYKGLTDYLMAKHGLERNSFFALKTRIAEEQQKRAEQVTAQMKAQAEQDYQDALNKAGQLTGIDLMNAVKAANRAKAKADRIAEQTGVEEGRKLRDTLYDGYTHDADLAQLKNDLRIKKITFREFEMRKRDIMEKHVKGTIKMIEDQGDKAGLSNIMDDDTDYENLAFNFVDSIESRLTTDTLWKRINSATGNTLEKSYSSGRMTKKAYDYVNSMFDFYVPLRGWDETTADEVYEYENASRPVFTPAVKRMFGRKSKAEDPIAYIGNQAVSEISLGNKNLMKQYLLRLAQNHPTSALSVSEVWYENVGTQSKPQWVEVAPNITEGMSATDITAEMDRFKQDMEQKRKQGLAKRQSEKLSVGMPILPMQENEHRVDVMVDGQKYSIFVNGSPKAAQAINGTNKKNVDFHLGDNFISKTNRFISEVLTSKNPAFVPANFARDMLGAHSQIWTKEDAGYIWNFEKNVAKVITTPRIGGKLGVTGYMPELIRKWKAGTLDTNNDIERYFSEFMEHGGETGYVNMLGVDKFKENIQKKLDNFNGHYGKNAWNAVWDTVEFYNRAVEDATRFITYMTSREQGRSVDRAIDDAKTISLNFNRKGTGAKGNALLRKLVIFVNPAIQALDNQFKLISQHPGRYAAVVGSLILRGMAQSKLNELLINLLGDDDDKDSYYQIPEWTRRNNLVLWIPGTHNFFKIPLSQEFRMWYGLGETMQGIIDGKTKSNPAMELATSMMGLLPVDPSGNGGNPIANVMPTIAKPVYEITQNENFLGLPIYKDNQGNEYEPEFQRVSYGTPPWLTKASEGLNMLTGGDTHERGALEQWTAGNKYARLLTNPSVWNHLLSGYVGGPYNIISQSIGLGTDFYEGKGLTVGNTPIVSRFVARPSERSSAGRTSDIYRDLVKEAEETRSHYSHYRKDYEKAVANGDEESAQKAMDKMREITESPEFLKMRTIEVYDKQINKVRQIIKLYDDKESKKRYGEMIKLMEENLLKQLEAYDAEEANIKK